MSNILEVNDIHTFIGQFHILEGITVEVPRNSITVLLGRNGVGKTTTLKSIIGLTPPSRGTIKFKEEEINGWRPFNIARLGIGYVPDYRAIFNQLSVEENLKLAERQKGSSRCWPLRVPLCQTMSCC
jgi:branched-chain amino acid transport system ATP-binding protein